MNESDVITEQSSRVFSRLCYIKDKLEGDAALARLFREFYLGKPSFINGSDHYWNYVLYQNCLGEEVPGQPDELMEIPKEIRLAVLTAEIGL